MIGTLDLWSDLHNAISAISDPSYKDLVSIRARHDLQHAVFFQRVFPLVTALQMKYPRRGVVIVSGTDSVFINASVFLGACDNVFFEF